jgi:hypothetical protein
MIGQMMRRFWRDLDLLDGAVTVIYKLSTRGYGDRTALWEVRAGFGKGVVDD